MPACYFVFTDLGLGRLGAYRLQFALFEVKHGADGVKHAQLASVMSEAFTVFPADAEDAPDPVQPSELMLSFAKQGGGIRVGPARTPAERRQAPAATTAASKKQKKTRAPTVKDKKAPVQTKKPTRQLMPRRRSLARYRENEIDDLDAELESSSLSDADEDASDDHRSASQ